MTVKTGQPKDFDEFWTVRPLPAEDQKLVDAYVQTGVPADRLAYTEAFEELVKRLGRPVEPNELHAVFRRLLLLRKMGRLPRLRTVVEDSE